MENLINGILANKEWIFSGIGIVVLGWFSKRFQIWRDKRQVIQSAPITTISQPSSTVPLQLSGESLLQRSRNSFVDFVEIDGSLKERFLEHSEFMKGMLGADVSWTGYVISVSEYPEIPSPMSVMIEPTPGRSSHAAAATFGKEWKAKLFSLRKHDKVRIEAIYRGSVAPLRLEGKSLDLLLEVALPLESGNHDIAADNMCKDLGKEKG